MIKHLKIIKALTIKEQGQVLYEKNKINEIYYEKWTQRKCLLSISDFEYIIKNNYRDKKEFLLGIQNVEEEKNMQELYDFMAKQR